MGNDSGIDQAALDASLEEKAAMLSNTMEALGFHRLRHNGTSFDGLKTQLQNFATHHGYTAMAHGIEGKAEAVAQAREFSGDDFSLTDQNLDQVFSWLKNDVAPNPDNFALRVVGVDSSEREAQALTNLAAYEKAYPNAAQNAQAPTQEEFKNTATEQAVEASGSQNNASSAAAEATAQETYAFDPNQVAYLQTALAVLGHNPVENIDGVEGQVTADAIGSFLGHDNYDDFGRIETVIEDLQGKIREADPAVLREGLDKVRQQYADFDGVNGAQGANNVVQLVQETLDRQPMAKLDGLDVGTIAGSYTETFNTVALAQTPFSAMGLETDNERVIEKGQEAYDRAVKEFGADNIPEGGVMFVPKHGTAFLVNDTGAGLEVRQIDPLKVDLDRTALDPDLQSDIVTAYQTKYSNNDGVLPADVKVKGVTFSTAAGPAEATLDLSEYKGIKDRFFTQEAKDEIKQEAHEEKLEQKIFDKALKEEQTPGSGDYLEDHVKVKGETYRVDEQANAETNGFSMEGYEALDTEQAVLHYTDADGTVHEVNTTVEALEEASKNLRQQFRQAGEGGREIRSQYKDFQKSMKDYQQSTNRGEFDSHETVLKQRFNDVADKTCAEIGPYGTKIELNDNMARTLAVELEKMKGISMDAGQDKLSPATTPAAL